DLKTAKEAIERAIGILKTELDRLTPYPSDPGEPASEDLRNVAAALADSYGSLGGLLRRQEPPGIATALESYRAGMELEENDRYRITSTYNRVQWTVLSIIDKPALLKEESFTQRLEAMLNRLLRHSATIRRDDPWALADLGLLATLTEDEL